jgi:hypothetical protein
MAIQIAFMEEQSKQPDSSEKEHKLDICIQKKPRMPIACMIIGGITLFLITQ